MLPVAGSMLPMCLLNDAKRCDYESLARFGFGPGVLANVLSNGAAFTRLFNYGVLPNAAGCFYLPDDERAREETRYPGAVLIILEPT
ncbi:hypothetical protein ACLKA7_006059 [Drosophila subpalustris]